MIRTYWLRILFCGIVAAILGFIIGLATPKQYDAIAQVMVAPYSPTMSNSGDPSDDAIKDIIDSTAPRSVSTQVEMLTSYGVIQEAAMRVANDLNLHYSDPGDELNPFDLQDKIAITAAKESDIVTLRVRMSKPELAQRVAQAMYLAFEKENNDQSKDAAERATEFLKTQTATISDQLSAIELKASKAKEEAHSPNIEQQIIADITELKELDTQLENARGDQIASQARADELQQRIAGLPEFIDGASGKTENPEYSLLVQELRSAEAERDQLSPTYLDESQQMKAIDKRIAGIKAKLKSVERFIITSTQRVNNPNYQGLKSEINDAVALAKAASQRANVIQAAVDKKQAELSKLPAVQRELDDLTRQQTVLERISQLYTSKLKTLEYAGQVRRTSTHLITQAVAIPRPAVPNFGLNVGLGLFLGLAVGFLWSIGSEAKRNPIRSLGQLNRLALQPCYRVVPELRVPMRGLTRAPAEVFDSLLVNFIRSEKKGYRLGVLGVTKNAGATTTAMNLAIAAARGGYSVLYVEVDPGNNALTKLTPSAGDVKSPGANIAIYNASLGETLGSGTIGLPTDLEVASQGKDLIIFDFSPVKVSGDAFLLANQLDEMILLVRANVTKSVDFLQAQQALIDAGCPLVSVTLTRVHDQSDDVSALEQQADVRSITPQA